MADRLRGGSTVGGGLIWHSANDGAGSGLDADLLDGQQGSYYLNTSNISGTTQTTGANSLTTTGSRTYAIQADASGNLVVNVPWVDTNTNTTYTAGTGLTLNGTTFDANVSATTQTVGANAVTATASRTYAVQVDASDNLVVNVPWSDTDTNTNTTYTLTAAQTGSPATDTNPAISLNGSDASTDTIVLVGTGATTVTRDNDGQITISSTDTNTNTTYTAGKGLTLNSTTFDANVSGTTQTVAANAVSATASRTYAVQVDASDNLVVNVPWSDTDTNTNTTYTLTAVQTGSPASNTDPAISLNGSDASTDTIQIVGTGATTVTRNDDGKITIDSTDTDTNNYVTGLSWASGTGIITATRSGLGDLTVDIDGRYPVLNSTTANSNAYLFLNRSSADNAVLYVNQRAATGDIARFVNDATTGTVGTAGGAAGQFTILNSGGFHAGADSTVVGLLTATQKSFTIPHPTKENMYLRYGSLEGPENGVYVRGNTTEKIIELPEYWTELVHEDSITVQLTSIGKPQKLYIKKIEDNKVYVGNASWFTKTNYSYIVYGERKDVDKLQVEF